MISGVHSRRFRRTHSSHHSTSSAVDSCLRKRRYPDETMARAVGSRSCELSKTQRLWVYHCPACDGWHLTSRRQGGAASITADNPFDRNRKPNIADPAPSGAETVMSAKVTQRIPDIDINEAMSSTQKRKGVVCSDQPLPTQTVPPVIREDLTGLRKGNLVVVGYGGLEVAG